ncbi:hypothetical protein IAU59_005329 [Kwoniella sp. CBS 9459]
MAKWKDAPLLHSTNQTYLDSLSNNTDPYSISYGNSAIVSQSTVNVYATLNLLGIALLLILVLTILLPRKNKLRRDPCLINAFFVIILMNLINLWYWMASGGSITSYEVSYLPHPKLCRAQAVLQAGSQAAQMSAVLGVVIRLWLKTISLSKPYFSRFRGKYTLTLLLALPYLCLLSFVPPVVLKTDDAKQPLLIPTPFYCSLIDIDIRRGYQIMTGVIAILTLIMELWTIHLVTYHFRQTTRTSFQAHRSLSATHGIRLETVVRPTRLLKRSFYVRVILFVLWTMNMIMATLYQAFDSTITDPNSDLVFACTGPVAFLCFATQADILKMWRVPTSISQVRALLHLGSSKSLLPLETSSSTGTRMNPESGARHRPRHHRRRGQHDFDFDDDGDGDEQYEMDEGIPTSQPETLDLQDFLGGPSMKIVNTPVTESYSRRGSRAAGVLPSTSTVAAPMDRFETDLAATSNSNNDKDGIGYEVEKVEEKDLPVYHLEESHRTQGGDSVGRCQGSHPSDRDRDAVQSGRGTGRGLVVSFDQLPTLDRDDNIDNDRRAEDMV